MWLYAEYDEANHTLMKELYNNAFADESLIRISGRAILDRGGPNALWANAYALNRIMVYMTAACEDHLLEASIVEDPEGGADHPIFPITVLCAANKLFLEPVWEQLAMR